ncbi:MAG: HzsA-related protein, partial [Planctomycetota bacterium]
RILYDRWEYVDRNFGDAQGLWAVNPDGTNHVVFWGNNTWSPGGAIDGRAIPGTGQVMCVFSSCHDRPWGALAIIDQGLGVDGRHSVVRTWPAEAIELVKQPSPKYDVYGFDNFKKVNPKYEDPYPLSDKYFLCARMTGEGERMGIYLIDVFGNEVLVHVEGEGCYDPMPLGPRARPPAIPSRREFARKPGTFYVTDVYEGTHMQGVERGTIKYLRVVESPEKRYWTHTEWGGQGVHCPALNWHSFENKRILGTVPVEADGSAYFEVPADKFVYFQLLDKNKMMVQSMRSGTTIQPGELSGCVGCHESRLKAPVPLQHKVPLAVQREPSKLDGWKGPARLFSYMQEVQPVFDRHCVQCHDYGTEAGEKLNLARDRTNTFNTSYNELWRQKYIRAIGAGPADTQRAYSWGSHPSTLVQAIRDGHEDVELSVDEFERIVTWIDINATYYPRYDSAYPQNLAGRSPLNKEQIKRLTELTGAPLAKLARHNSNLGPQVSFDRPEVSPCLTKIEDPNSPAYAEALAIIQAGKAMLAQRPRADMVDFEACPIDQQRERKYVQQQQLEAANRQAIRENTRRYDVDTR